MHRLGHVAAGVGRLGKCLHGIARLSREHRAFLVAPAVERVGAGNVDAVEKRAGVRILCSLLASFGFATGCGSSTATAPAARVLRYAGTVNQPAGAGFLVYRMAGSWTLAADGSLISGVDSVQILDAKVYGQAGTASAVLKTDCVAVVGKEAWAESVIVSSSDPVSMPVGTRSVTHLSIAGAAPKGGGGPHDGWYPNGNVCVDRPATMAAFDMQNGYVTFP